MTPRGSFCTSAALAINLTNADIKSQVASWSFNDGVITYDNTNSSLDECHVSTDSGGIVTNFVIGITLIPATGRLVMNSTYDPFMPMSINPAGDSITMAQRWPTTFTTSA
jgi:hypothetical protein